MATNEEKPVFSCDDVVVTIEDEQDIELIPAGTPVRLLSALSKEGSKLRIWSGVAKINDIARIIVVFESNLKHAF